MKKISRSKARAHGVMLRSVLRWLLYAAVLLLFYSFLCNPIIPGYCPLIIIPLATAVAMYEGDLASGIFGAVCGIMLDMADGSSVVGFTALWLLCLCPFISLLSRFLIKVNFVSHFVINAAVTVIIGGLDMLFMHWVWEGSQSVISLTRIILPSYCGAILFSVPIYFLVRFISNKFNPQERKTPEEHAEEEESDKN